MKTFTLLLTLLWTTVAYAQNKTYIPPDLQQWKQWVLFEQQEKLCPTVLNDSTQHQCKFSKLLKLEIDQKQAKFQQEWHILQPDLVSLPYAANTWPQQVQLDNKPSPVVEKNNKPFIYLTPGQHSIQGKLFWQSTPDKLYLDPLTARTELWQQGQKINFPRRIKANILSLQEKSKTAPSQDKIEVRISRLFKDLRPMQVITRVQVKLSGSPRSISLPHILLPQTTILKFSSPFGLEFSPANEILFQAGAGKYNFKIISRFDQEVSRIKVPDTGFGPEIWAFSARPDLRVVRLNGMEAIDPKMTDIEDKWQNFPCYLARPGQNLTLKQVHRGLQANQPNSLRLKRRIWLDFDGQGFTIEDKIQGQMNSGWQVLSQKDLRPGRATVNGQDQPLVLLGNDKNVGLELRQSNMNLSIASRADRKSIMPCTGWRQTFEHVQAELQLPPGWSLFMASGVDKIYSSWISRWNLLNIFLALLISLAMFKVCGLGWGVLMVLYLGLSFHQPQAPKTIWLGAIAGIAALRLLQNSGMFTGWEVLCRLSKMIYLTSLIGLVLYLLPFTVQQVRWAIYPQLQAGYSSPERTGISSYDRILKSQAVQESMNYSKGKYYPSPAPARQKQTQYENQAQIQTGPGIPNWKWQKIRLEWSGPVGASQKMKLYLIPPWLNKIAFFLRIFMAWALLIPICKFSYLRLQSPKGEQFIFSSLALTGLFFILALPGIAVASPIPTPELLQNLQQRLLQPAPCYPSCISAPYLKLSLNKTKINMDYTIHSLSRTSIPLPVIDNFWQADSIKINSKIPELIYRDEQKIYIVVEPGIHNININGKLKLLKEFHINLPLEVKTIEINAPDWEILGIQKNMTPGSNLQLTRKNKKDLQKTIDAVNIPDFVNIRRIFNFDQQWSLNTTITRLSSNKHALNMQIPLLPQEQVLNKNIQIQQNKAQVNMKPGQSSFSWTSALPISSSLQLKASQNVPWTETWELKPAAMWHIDYKGIPLVQKVQEGRWQPGWQPWPGEELNIALNRLQSAPGKSLTIDQVKYTTDLGHQQDKIKLDVHLRSSKGGRQVIILPHNISKPQLKSGQTNIPVVNSQKGLVLPIYPGQQNYTLSWLQPRNSQLNLQPGPIDLQTEAVNLRMQVNIPKNRWVIMVWSGPAIGPAVLIWSYLGAILIMSIILGRLSFSPLKFYQWFLLGMGLSQLPVGQVVLAVAWLPALALRKKYPPQTGWFIFNTCQLGLIFLTILGLGGLYLAVQHGLLAMPNMHITGNNSSAYSLIWFQDRINGVLPRPNIISLPLYVYRILMLFWSLWLAWSLLGWLKWSWTCISEQGFWRKAVWKKKKIKQEDKAPA